MSMQNVTMYTVFPLEKYNNACAYISIVRALSSYAWITIASKHFDYGRMRYSQYRILSFIYFGTQTYKTRLHYPTGDTVDVKYLMTRLNIILIRDLLYNRMRIDKNRMV